MCQVSQKRGSVLSRHLILIDYKKSKESTLLSQDLLNGSLSDFLWSIGLTTESHTQRRQDVIYLSIVLYVLS